MKKTIAAYLRVSTDRQADFGVGLDVQEEKIRKYISTNHFDESALEFFIDDGYSGGNLNRPRIKELIKKIKQGLISDICIYNISRLTRDVQDIFMFMDIFRKHAVNFICISLPVDIGNANGRLETAMHSFFYQWERETGIERVRDCMSYRAINDKEFIFGRTPYGFTKNDMKNLLIKEDEAVLVKKCFEMADAGYSRKDITAYMNEFSNKIWNNNAISRLLKNSLYVGDLENSLVTVREFCQPIIDKGTFDRVSKKTFRIERHTKYLYLFRGKVICEECQNICVPKSAISRNKPYKYYVCPRCNKRIGEGRIIKFVENEISDYFEKFRLNKLKECQSKIKRLNNKKKQFYDQVVSERISTETYDEFIMKLKIELNMLEKQSLELSNSSMNVNTFASLEEKGSENIIKKIIDKMTINLEKRTLIELKKKC